MKRVFLVFTSMFFLVSCAPIDNVPSILEGQVCGVSCWNHIVIGKTTRQELKEIISQIPNADQSSVTNLDDPSGYVFFQVYRDWKNKKFPVSIGVMAGYDNKVSRITFMGDLGLTAQQITDIFGEPDFASSKRSGEGGVCVSLINSQHGTVFGECANSEKSSITPNAKIVHLVLFDPAKFQTLVDENFLKADTSYTLYPWSGYGKIEDHYWPPRKQQ